MNKLQDSSQEHSPEAHLKVAYLINIGLQFGDRFASIFVMLALISYTSNYNFSLINELIIAASLLGILSDFGTSQGIHHAIQEGKFSEIFILRAILFFVSLLLFALIFQYNIFEFIFIASYIFELLCRPSQFFIEYPKYKNYFISSSVVKLLGSAVICLDFYINSNLSIENILIALSAISFLSGAICFFAIIKKLDRKGWNSRELLMLMKGGCLICTSQCLYMGRMAIPLLIIGAFQVDVLKEFRVWGVGQSIYQQVIFVVCGSYFALLSVGARVGAKFILAIIKLQVLAFLVLLASILIIKNVDISGFNQLYKYTKSILLNWVPTLLILLTMPASLGLITFFTSIKKIKQVNISNFVGILGILTLSLAFISTKNIAYMFLSPFIFDVLVILILVIYGKYQDSFEATNGKNIQFLKL